MRKGRWDSVSEDNKVFTYPEFTGRRRIYTDVEKITKENIFQVLEEAMLVHMENANNNTGTRTWVQRSTYLEGVVAICTVV